MPIHDPDRAGKSYRPSCGAEGEIFMTRYCYRCRKDHPEQGCDIVLGTMTLDVDDPEYPKEWIFDAQGRPTCTAFEASE